MTKTELNSSWNKVLEILDGKIQKINVDSFFRPLKPEKLSEKEGVLTVLASSGADFMQNMLSRYKTQLDESMTEVFGKPYKVVVTDKSLGADENLPEDSQLDPRYTFETFVPGSSSNLAYAASLAVAQSYDNKYNPLFLYGGSGLGKTHLMHAIGQYVLRNKPRKKVLYVTAESFTNEFVLSLQNKNPEDFRRKYRNVDYLLFDDVQFIQGKSATEEELFNTFNALHDAKKQIVFTSDKPPKDLGDIPERLITRFSWGLIVDIQPPDYETRMAILKNKAMMENVELSDEMMEVLDTIAQGIKSNIRELESAFNRVLAFSAMSGQPMTKSYTREVLSEVYDSQVSEITPESIKQAVADYFSVKVSDLEGPGQSRDIAYPRHIAIYLIRENTNLSLPAIGKYFGGKHHTSVLHSYNKIKEEMLSRKELRQSIENISSKL